ncbi:MAG: M48 family metallopeptidase [Vicinamibacteraceae bacterium]
MKPSRRSTKPLAAAFAVVVVILAGSSVALAQLGRAIGSAMKAGKALTLSDEEVVASADEACTEMDNRNTIPPDADPYAQRLARITQGLESEDGLSLNFKVYAVKDLNAFAMPNGCVRVFTGLLDLLSDEEIEGVVGHEIGHVKLGHSRAKMRTALLARAGREGVAFNSGAAGAISRSELGDLAEVVVNAQFSQKEERAADDYGFEFLVRHDADPTAMASAFEKLPGGGGGLISTHPDPKERAKRIRERAQQ